MAPEVWFLGSMCAHARLSAFLLFPLFFLDGIPLINWRGHTGLPSTIISGHTLPNLPRSRGPSRLGLPICWGCIRICHRPLEMIHWLKNPSTGTAQQRLFLVLKVVLHAVVVISEVLRLSTKSPLQPLPARAHLYRPFNTTTMTFAPEALWCVLDERFESHTFEHGAADLLAGVPSRNALTWISSPPKGTSTSLDG